jgi:hypothetical protein
MLKYEYQNDATNFNKCRYNTNVIIKYQMLWYESQTDAKKISNGTKSIRTAHNSFERRRKLIAPVEKVDHSLKISLSCLRWIALDKRWSEEQ